MKGAEKKKPIWNKTTPMVQDICKVRFHHQLQTLQNPQNILYYNFSKWPTKKKRGTILHSQLPITHHKVHAPTKSSLTKQRKPMMTQTKKEPNNCF